MVEDAVTAACWQKRVANRARALPRYTQDLRTAPFSSTLAIIAIGNLFAMAILNGFALTAGAILWVLPLSFATAYLAVRGIRWRSPRIPVPRIALAIAIAWVVLLTIPRLPYLLDRLPDGNILATGDDHGRLAELVSLTRSPRYPTLHPSNQDFLLSHYYAAFMPMAWAEFAVPSLSLKECILLGNLLYHVLFAGVILEFAVRLLRSRWAVVAFTFLMTFFGGLDWITTLPLLFAHHEHWFKHLFGEWREISAMYTVVWWAVHHSVGLYCLLVAWLMLRNARWKQRWRKPFVVGLLLIAAFYSSIFALAALPFVAPKELWRISTRLLRNGLWMPLLTLACVPAFLLFGRITGPAFALAWPRLGPILVYLAGVLVLEFAFLPLLVLRNRRILGAAAFFVSVLFVNSVGLNNYTMRGMMLPTVILFLLSAPVLARFQWRKPLGIAAIVLTTIGVIREAAWLTYHPLERSPAYWRLTGREMPENAKELVSERKGLDRFNEEQLVSDTPVEKMEFNELELLRLPRRGWFR